MGFPIVQSPKPHGVEPVHLKEETFEDRVANAARDTILAMDHAIRVRVSFTEIFWFNSAAYSIIRPQHDLIQAYEDPRRHYSFRCPQ